MHQGKELREIAEKQKHIGKFAKQIGISRDTLYQLFKKQSIHPKHLEKLRTMGINLTPSDNTKYYSTKGHSLLRVSGTPRLSANSTGKHIVNSTNINRPSTYKGVDNSTPMNDLILMTIEDLILLQKQQEDVETVKAIQQIISYKQYTESLERENKLLKDMINLQQKTIENLERKK